MFILISCITNCKLFFSALKKEVAVQGEDVDRGEVSAQGEDVDRGEVSAEGEDVNRGEVSAQGEDVDGGEVSAQGEIVDRGVVSVHGEGIDRGEVHVGSEDHAPGDDSAQAENCDRGEDVARRGDEIPYADAAASADDIRDKINDSVSEEICKAVICRFCNKSRKKHQGREQKLHRIENDKSLIHIEQLALDLDDSDFLHKLKDVQSQNKLMFYHNFCRNTYQNSHTSKKTKEKEKTEWHRIRDVRSKAYKEVCKFIFEKIVATNQAFFLSSLNTMFIDYLKENKEDADVYTTKPYHLKNRILSTFKGKISIVTHDNKKLVKPYKGVVDREFEEIEKTKF